MTKIKMPHPEHDKHLCYLANLDFHNSNFDEYKELVEKPEYVCKNCGRAAKNRINLCNPVKM